MIKKIVSFIFILCIALITVSQTVHADLIQDSTEDIGMELTWTRANNGQWYLRSNRFLIATDEVSMYFETHLGDWSNAFLPSYGSFSSRARIYESFDTISVVDTLYIDYEDPEVTEYMILEGTESANGVDMSDYQGMYMEIFLMLNPNAEPAVPSLINNAQYWLNNYRDGSVYIFSVTWFYDFTSGAIISDLPLTSGNPYQEGAIGSVTSWNYAPLTGYFSVGVRYGSDYQLVIESVAFSDPSFLSKVESIDYYTIDDERYFQFNFTGSDNPLLGSATAVWNGFAVWNLTTNEFVQFNKALALSYLEVTENRELFAYLYMPFIPIDDLLSVSGWFNYRYGSRNIFGTQLYEEYQTGTFNLEKDAESYGATSVFEGALPQWTYDVLAASIPAFAVGSILSMIPGLQVIGLPLLFGGLAGIITSTAGAISHVKYGLIDEIELISPAPALRQTLNEHYTQASGMLTVLPVNAPIHKLFIGLFTKPGTNAFDVQTDPENENNQIFNYTEITWVTQGQVYSLDERFLDQDAILDQEYLDNLPPEGDSIPGNLWDEIVSFFQSAFGTIWQLAMIVAGAVVVYFFFKFLPVLDNGMRSLRSIGRRNKFLTLALIGVLIALLLGIINL